MTYRKIGDGGHVYVNNFWSNAKLWYLKNGQQMLDNINMGNGLALHKYKTQYSWYLQTQIDR